MKLAVMQPYIFPYLGYYQLVGAVDMFIFFDDVNFINKGWINRNNILQQNNAARFTVPLSKASQNKLINEIEISEYEKWRNDFLKSISFNYKKAPFFPVIYKWLEELLSAKNYHMISDLAADSVKGVAQLTGMETHFDYSSKINYDRETATNGQDKVLRICELNNAHQYINPKNGTELYDAEQFREKNIQLNFINMDEIVYHQFKGVNFVPNLSIIDVLMFNDISEVKTILKKYTLN